VDKRFFITKSIERPETYFFELKDIGNSFLLYDNYQCPQVVIKAQTKKRAYLKFKLKLYLGEVKIVEDSALEGFR